MATATRICGQLHIPSPSPSPSLSVASLAKIAAYPPTAPAPASKSLESSQFLKTAESCGTPSGITPVVRGNGWRNRGFYFSRWALGDGARVHWDSRRCRCALKAVDDLNSAERLENGSKRQQVRISRPKLGSRWQSSGAECRGEQVEEGVFILVEDGGVLEEREREREREEEDVGTALVRGNSGRLEGESSGRREEWGWKGRAILLAALPGVVGLNLEGPQSVLQALGVLAAIITVHETGHFMAARLQNIHVTKFAVGFGPTLAKFQRQGVEYSLRSFPLGGFVAFPDDDPNSEFDPDDPNLLKNRPMLDRAIVISAGVIANFIFAYSVLFVQTFSVGLLEQEMFPGVVVPEVISKSAAAKAGMKPGDVVLGVGGVNFSAKEAAVFELVDTIKKNAGNKLSLNVQRGTEVVNVDVVPEQNLDGSGRIGVQLSPNAKPHRIKAKNLGESVVLSAKEFSRLTLTVVEGLKQIVFNFEKTIDNVSGPVAIVAVGAEVARSDIAGLFQFAAIVNINLAIVNLLPLPALDGGYLAFVALEALRGGKKLPEGVEQGIMSSGVLLLLALGVVLMVRDTLNLGFVQQML